MPNPPSPTPNPKFETNWSIVLGGTVSQICIKYSGSTCLPWSTLSWNQDIFGTNSSILLSYWNLLNDVLTIASITHLLFWTYLCHIPTTF
jgi:hypothetical protein